MKMWAGRFSKELDKDINDFNSSISFDWVMFREDIKGSIAHAHMLCKSGILTEKDYTDIKAALQDIEKDIENGTLLIDDTAEDIHMFVEHELTERIGDAGKRLHTARSRNDQVATDLRLYLRKKSSELMDETKALAITLVNISEQHIDTVMPGYTHLQVAQPITFAHHLMAYAQMLRRDYERLQDAKKRMNQSPLGAGALAGTTYAIDRSFTAKELDFDGVCANSLDAVSDRDFCIELAAALSILMTHLSRLSEEIILWCSSEFSFIELDDAFATGSSIMPQKKNPDITELVRGKTARVYGDLTTLLSMMKNLPLAYNKDMQEDKPAVFDAVDTVLLCLKAMRPMIETMKVKKENMKKAAAKGFINATDCADYLVKKGMPFRDAYKITGQLVALCVAEGKTLESLPLSVYKEASDLFCDDVHKAIDLATCISERSSEGGPSPKAVRDQIDKYKKAMQIK